jgi:ribosomal protein S10
MEVLKLQLKATNKNLLFLYYNLLTKILKKLQIKHKKIIICKKKRYTILKSPHVFKKAREQFEIKSYKLTILSESIKNLKYLKYFILNKPKIIKLSIKQIKRK